MTVLALVTDLIASCYINDSVLTFPFVGSAIAQSRSRVLWRGGNAYYGTSRNGSKIYPPLYLTPEQYEVDGKVILYVYVPVGKTVYRKAGRIFDRNNEWDINITDNAD